MPDVQTILKSYEKEYGIKTRNQNSMDGYLYTILRLRPTNLINRHNKQQPSNFFHRKILMTLLTLLMTNSTRFNNFSKWRSFFLHHPFI